LSLYCRTFAANVFGEDAIALKGKIVDKTEHAPIRNVCILVEMDGFFGNLVGGE
jgi:hypothetical protein